MRRSGIFAAFILLLAAAVHARAAALPYWEFLPDRSDPFVVSGAESVAELFFPQNDFLGGVDLWLSNADTAGDLTLILTDAQNHQVTSRTVTMPAIGDSSNGTRFHVDFTSQPAVTANEIYTLSISSPVPGLRLYWARTNELLSHNAAQVPIYQSGVARIGDQVTNSGFKLALYERQESKKPNIGTVTATVVSLNSVRLDFTSSEPVDSRVVYGPSGSGSTVEYSGQYTPCVDATDPCSITLAAIPDTHYSYTLTVKDIWGNESSVQGTFESAITGQETPTPTVTATATPVPTTSVTPTPQPTPPDTTIPILSNVRVSSVTDRSAIFTWTTNEVATSEVLISFSYLLLTVDFEADSTLELEHTIHTGLLEPDTTYLARIRSYDASSNPVTQTLSFKTLARQPEPTSSPQTTPTPTPTLSFTPGGQVSWIPPPSQPNDGYRVDIFDANNQLIRSVTLSGDQTTADIPDIPEGSRIVVYGKNGDVYEKVAAVGIVPKRQSPRSSLEMILAYAPYALGGFAVAAIVIALVVRTTKKRKPPGLTPPTQPVIPALPPAA